MKKIIIKYAKIVIILSIIYFLIKTLLNNYTQVSNYSFNIDLSLLLISFLLLTLSYFNAAFGWGYILRKLNQKLSIKHSISIFLKSQLTRYLPGAIWPYLGKMYMAKKNKVPRTISFVSMILESVFLISSSAILSLIIFLFYLKFEIINQYLIFIIAAIISLFLCHPKIINLITLLISKIIKKKIVKININYSNVFKIFLIYFLRGILLGLGFLFFVISIYPLEHQNFMFLAGISLLSWLTGYLFIIAPGGIGIKEATVYLLLQFIIPPGIAITIAILSRLWLIIGELFTLGIFSIINRYINKN